MFDLNKKVVLVAGGRGYLGRNICNHLASQKALVISADLKKVSSFGNKLNYKKKGSNIIQVNMDVTDESSVSEVVEEVLKRFKKIDVLVYSVTSKPKDFYSPYTKCSLDGWRNVIRTELDGAFIVTKKIGAVMEMQKKGSIIFLSSIYGVVGNDQSIYSGSNLDNIYVQRNNNKKKKLFSHSSYPTAKGGLISLARYLSTYWGKKNIRVNCVSPGGIFHKKENTLFLKKYSNKVPMGRKAQLNEISPAIIYLASDESSYLTGQNIIIDGGFTAW